MPETPDWLPEDNPAPFGQMADVERRMGLDPIHELLAQRQALVAEVAGLRAKYGTFGTFDALRKSMLSQIRMAVRATAMRDKRKVTESQLDEEAHADERYAAFLTTATQERTRLAVVEAKIDAIDAVVNRGQAVARFLSMETRL